MNSISAKTVVIVVALIVIIGGAAVFLTANNSDKGDNTLYEVIDATGNKIKLDVVPEKIISLNALTTEAICELGLTSNIIGVTSDAGVHDVTNFIYGMDFDIEYPDQLKAQIKSGKTALVGPSTSWSVEKVMTYDPDLVVFQTSADNLNKMALLQEMGITCLVLNNNTYATDVPGSIYENMEILGKALGKLDRAEMFNSNMKKTLDYIYAYCDGFKGKDVITMAISGGSLFAYAGNNFKHVILRELGCTTNMAGAATGVVSVENVLQYQPDIIIFSPGSFSEDILALEEQLEKDPLWADVKAMQNGEIYYLEYAARQSTSSLSHHFVHGVGLLATIVFDEIDIDVPQYVEEGKYLEYISWIDKK